MISPPEGSLYGPHGRCEVIISLINLNFSGKKWHDFVYLESCLLSAAAILPDFLSLQISSKEKCIGIIYGRPVKLFLWLWGITLYYIVMITCSYFQIFPSSRIRLIFLVFESEYWGKKRCISSYCSNSSLSFEQYLPRNSGFYFSVAYSSVFGMWTNFVQLVCNSLCGLCLTHWLVSISIKISLHKRLESSWSNKRFCFL